MRQKIYGENTFVCPCMVESGDGIGRRCEMGRGGSLVTSFSRELPPMLMVPLCGANPHPDSF